MNPVQKRAVPALLVALSAMLTGCGMQGAPQPPSLNLPDPVADLAATRAGNQVSLTWTMPKRNTDKLPLKNEVAVLICRREGAGACAPAGSLSLGAGASGSFVETLSSALAAGSPRPLIYFVELKNRSGRSAGLSNAAAVLAGQSPAPIAGLTAEMRKEGVSLHWQPDSGSGAVRLHRKLLSPPTPKPHEVGLAPTPEPIEQSLLVESATSGAVDKSATLGQTYEYRAQRILRATIDGNTVELPGELSSPVRIETKDVFPPAVPTDLVAVATATDAATGAPASIDLSWQPSADNNLAGYEVYRREDMTPWRRISGEQPAVGPAFRDAQVVPGHTYRYAVSAVSQSGHESTRSDEAQETVPNP